MTNSLSGKVQKEKEISVDTKAWAQIIQTAYKEVSNNLLGRILIFRVKSKQAKEEFSQSSTLIWFRQQHSHRPQLMASAPNQRDQITQVYQVIFQNTSGKWILKELTSSIET